MAGAIASAIGQTLTAGAQIYNNERNMSFNMQEAQKNRDFQHTEAMLEREWSERMSNTAYQRTVADMKNAGLNPLLAYSNAPSLAPSGASAGSVSSGNFTSSAPDIGAPFNAYAKNTAKEASDQAKMNLEQQRLDVDRAQLQVNTARESSLHNLRQLRIDLMQEQKEAREAYRLAKETSRRSK